MSALTTPWVELRSWGDLARWHAATRPQAIAFEDVEDGHRTFGDFNRRVNRLNSAFASLGIAKGARVAILARNRIEYVESYGLAKSGIVLVPLNWRLTAEELETLLRHSGAVAVICDADHAAVGETLRSRLPDIRCWIATGFQADGWLAYEDVLATRSDGEPTAEVLPDDPLCLMYTSGTTGLPKGVMLTHRGVLGNAEVAATALGLGPADRSLAAMPLFHVGGMWYYLHASFAAGAHSVLMRGFEPGALLREMGARKITNVHLVPTMVAAIVNHPEAGRVDLDALRLIFYAASPMPMELLRQALKTFPRCGFLQSYGSTESGMLTALTPADHRQERALASCGRALPGNAVRVVDADGAAVPVGVIGDIVTSSQRMMAGYWQDAAATSRVLADGWLQVGDLGYFDADGYLYIVDRKNDMIVTGGENVYPSEVEAVLCRNPAILAASVFGLPDPRWVEKVVAAVVLRPGVATDGAAVIAEARRHLAAYKCPKEIRFVEALPMNAVGKVLRKELRKTFGEALHAGTS